MNTVEYQREHMTTIIADFTDILAEPFANRRVVFNPTTYPNIYGTNRHISLGDAQTFITELDGTLTGSLVPGVYDVEAFGLYRVSKFSIAVPDTNTPTNVADIIVTGSGKNSGSMAWSIQVSDEIGRASCRER